MSQKIKTLVDLQSFAGSNYSVERNASKKLVLTDKLTSSESVFNNIAQVVTYLELEKARATPVTLNPELTKQGGDALKVDTGKLLLFSSQIKSPRPSTVKSPDATAQLKKLAGKDAYDAVVKMLCYTGDDGKDKNRPELVAVGTIRDEWKKFLDDHSLNISMNGAKVVSVHHVDKIVQFADEINDKLAKQASIIQAMLPEWKQDAIASGRYVDGKFPDASYFEGYGIKHRFAKFGEDFDYSDEVSEVRESAVNKLSEAISTTVNALDECLSGPKRSFKEASIANLYHSAEALKENGFIDCDKFESLCDKVASFAKDFDSDGVRASQKKIKTGVKVPKTQGKGRRCIPVTQNDLDAEKKKLETVCDPLRDLQNELDGLI